VYSPLVFGDAKTPNIQERDAAFAAQIQNRKGKEAWLSIVANREAGKAVLSLDKKPIFVVRDAAGGR
jgi:hypothetical protein